METLKQVIVLGSGTSTGVPVLGCACKVCKSLDPLDKRTRASILLKTQSGRCFVIDTGPDFRSQMLREGVDRLDGVLFTHTHADHLHGFDDLRGFFFSQRKPIYCYAWQKHIEEIQGRFGYVFKDTGYQGLVPQVLMQPIEPEQPGQKIEQLGLEIDTLLLDHGHVESVAFKFGSFAYATDFKAFRPEQIQKWKGKIHTMIASGIHFNKHPAHSVIPETVELFKKLEVKKGYISHISHQAAHQDVVQSVPPWVRPCYDGLQVNLSVRV